MNDSQDTKTTQPIKRLLKTQPTDFLGIYLAKDRATVVCLAVRDGERKLTGCFSVALEQAEQPACSSATLKQPVSFLSPSRTAKQTTVARSLAKYIPRKSVGCVFSNLLIGCVVLVSCESFILQYPI